MTAYDGNATSVHLPDGETVLGIFPGGTSDYTGDWPTARADLETWLNTGGVTGHRFKMLHGIAGSSWQSTSYGNCRGLWQNLPADVQPLISIPSFFPQFQVNADGSTVMHVSGDTQAYVTDTNSPDYGKVYATYDWALTSPVFSSMADTLLAQVAADYPYSSVRCGQEFDGDWFWWGLTHTVGKAAEHNGGTAQKCADLITMLSNKLRGFGWKGTWEVNAGNYQGFDINTVTDLLDPAVWDIAGVDSYDLGATTSQALDPVASWNGIMQLQMIQNAIDAAAKHGKKWAMSEWGFTKYVDGSPQTGVVDNAYYYQQVRALALDTSLPHCAYLSLFFGNDYNSNGSMHRRDAMANPASITSGPWSDDANCPKGIAELKSADWTPQNLTRADAGGGTGGGGGTIGATWRLITARVKATRVIILGHSGGSGGGNTPPGTAAGTVNASVAFTSTATGHAPTTGVPHGSVTGAWPTDWPTDWPAAVTFTGTASGHNDTTSSGDTVTATVGSTV